MRSSNGQRKIFPVAALVLALSVLLWQGSALAGFDMEKPGSKPSSDEQSGTVSEPEPAAETESKAPKSGKAPVSTSKSSTAQEEPVEETTGGATADATVAHVSVGGQEIITVSRSESEAHDDGCRASAVGLSVLGAIQLGGAEAECAPNQEVVDQGALIDTCGPSGGQLCIAVLYGYASASDNPDETNSASQSDVVSACVGGEQESPREMCDGPIDARVAHSESESRRNKKSGEANAHQESSLVDVCLGGRDPETGVCGGIGLILLHSEGDGTALPGQDAEMGGSSYLVNVVLAGEENIVPIGDSENDLPPGCMDAEGGPGALCIGVADGDTTVEAGKGSHYQEAVGLDAIDLVTGNVDDGTITADSTKARPPKVNPPKPPKPDKPKKKKPTLAAPTGPALASTGAGVVPAALFGLVLILLGARLVARKPEKARL